MHTQYLKSVVSSKEYARKYAIQSEKHYDYRTLKSTKPKIIHQSYYNDNGNLIKTIDHHYKKYKDFETRYFFYDSLDKRIEEYSKIFF